MKEYYGARDLHPLDYPIKTYEEQMTECKGMYDCTPPVLGTKENFNGNNYSHGYKQVMFSDVITLLGVIAMIILIPYIFNTNKR